MKILGVTFALLLSDNAIAGDSERCKQPYSFPIVSIVELIAAPEKWDGKNLSVVGFGVFEYEGDAVYLHKEDFDLGLAQNAVAIGLKYKYDHSLLDPSLNLDGLNKTYIRVSGTFVAASRGVSYFSGVTAGEISNVCFVESWALRRE
jgi:hypothetical protein